MKFPFCRQPFAAVPEGPDCCAVPLPDPRLEQRSEADRRVPVHGADVLLQHKLGGDLRQRHLSRTRSGYFQCIPDKNEIILILKDNLASDKALCLTRL